MDVRVAVSNQDPSQWRPALGAASIVPNDRSEEPRPVAVVTRLQDGLPRKTKEPAATLRRIHFGDLVVELEPRHAARQSSANLRIRDQSAGLLIPVAGRADIVADELHITCHAGTAFLFSRDDTATVIWPRGSWGLLVHLRRDRINAAASAIRGDARRLASIAVTLDANDLDAMFGHVVRRHFAGAEEDTLRPGPALLMLETQFYRRLAEHLATHDECDALIAPVRSVSEAMRIVRENHRQAFDTDNLAAAAGVTAQTLRKGFKSCLGMSVKEFIQLVRLEWARDRLASARDSRPIAELAEQAGFTRGPPFSRAYLKRYGEPPSQTRARAVRLARE